MSKFFKDWDEVKNYIKKSPKSHEREGLYRKALNSTEVIKRNIKTIQTEIYLWPTIKKFLIWTCQYKYLPGCLAILTFLCLLNLASSIVYIILSIIFILMFLLSIDRTLEDVN